MKKIVSTTLIVTTQLLIGGLFLVMLFSTSKENNSVVMVSNNNINKLADVNSNLLKIEDIKTERESTSESEEVVEKEVVEEIKEVIEQQPVIVEKKEEVVTTTPTKNNTDYNVLDTFSADNNTLTGYGPDCYGCTSGKTASGHNAYNTYYNDIEFGNIRVVAADPTISFCTVVKISNVTGMEPFIAIVLDRGGNVGYNKMTFMDLLFSSESEAKQAFAHGINRGISFEILRYGDGSSCMEY